MDRRKSGTTAGVALLLFVTLALVASAQTVTTLASFNGANGRSPDDWGGLVQGLDGELYGTTAYGGSFGVGSIFKISTEGTLTTLYSFCPEPSCSDGREPEGGLVQATNGYLYGTASSSGPGGFGTVFKITPDGALTTLYSFCSQPDCSDGQNPYAALIQAANGDLYGTTVGWGGLSSGTVFKITPSGSLTTLYKFCSQPNCADGKSPYGGLVQAADGNLYGTTNAGGLYGRGTVFKITPGGDLTTLYSFCSQSNCVDGASPVAGLVQAADGDFYGTTPGGGNGEGTIFRITPSGALTTLYSFCAQEGCPEGGGPEAGLVRATDGNLYGTTIDLGVYGHGTIFQVSTGGSLTTLYRFPSPVFSTPDSWLVQATNGSFYGVTSFSGAHNVGSVFGLSMGLGPFVESLPTSGDVGETVMILGTHLTGATSVTFNGTAADFTVVRPTEITATVPASATTGKIQVTVPSGVLSGNVVFRIR